MSSFLEAVRGFLYVTGYHRYDTFRHILQDEDDEITFKDKKDLKKIFKKMMKIYIKSTDFDQRYLCAEYVAKNCTCELEAYRIIDKYIRKGSDDFNGVF
jgi:hypothetical protein